MTPEDKFGPAGYDLPNIEPSGKQRFIQPGQMMQYRIDFWNDEDAVVPTQDAVIFDVLDPAIFDFTTFEFTRIGFLDWDMFLPGGQVIDVRIDTRPQMNIAVDVTASFNPETGRIDWWFHTVDPLTGDYPEDPMAGFLPPFNPVTEFELGWVEYRVKAWDHLPTGTRIENQAFVQFDFLPNPKTGQEWGPAPPEGPWVNTIDAGPPSSWIVGLPGVVNEAEFLVSWDGQDDEGGSGIGRYDVYVSTDHGPFTRWLTGTTDSSAVFPGEFGRRYDFFTVATDNVGHREAASHVADSGTYVNIWPVIGSLTASPAVVSQGGRISLTAHEVGDADGSVVQVQFYKGDLLLGSVEAGEDGWSLSVDTINWDLGEHTLTARARDNHGAWSEWVSTTVQFDNAAPVVASLGVTPDLVTTPDLLNLTAQGVSDPDGFVVQVTFFRGGELLGVVEEGSDDWTLRVETAGWPLGEHEFTARAKDNEGAWSEWVTATATVASWTNPENPLDVNADGVVSPLDVIAIINRINWQGDGPLPPRTWDNLDEPYYDVTENGHVIALDALRVINHLNFAGTGDSDEGGQGEAVAGGIAAEPWFSMASPMLGRSALWFASDSEMAADLRVDLLTVASEESVELLGRDLRQPAVRRPGTQPIDRFLGNRSRPGSELDEELPEWESLLAEQSVDRGSLDAFFAALS